MRGSSPIELHQVPEKWQATVPDDPPKIIPCKAVSPGANPWNISKDFHTPWTMAFTSSAPMARVRNMWRAKRTPIAWSIARPWSMYMAGRHSGTNTFESFWMLYFFPIADILMRRQMGKNWMKPTNMRSTEPTERRISAWRRRIASSIASAKPSIGAATNPDLA